MAVTWTAAAPHATAVKEVQKAGLGSGYGPSGTSVFSALKWPGNKRAVLTKLSASGTYSAGGDAITPSTFGLKEIHAAFVVGSVTANVLPVNATAAAGKGVPVIDATTPGTPKVAIMVAGADAAAATDLAGTVFHVVLVGI